MATMDPFERRFKALGAQLYAGERHVGESQADNILDLHRLVNWSVDRNHEVDLVVLFDLRDPEPLYLGKMVRDETGVWTQINAHDEFAKFVATGETNVQKIADAMMANHLAAAQGPDGTILDENVWGQTFLPSELGRITEIVKWMSGEKS
jgi:hypothetical protein